MTGIGNTIETDLVGEFVELWDPGAAERPGGSRLADEPYRPAIKPHVRARGRVRAMAHSTNGLLVWIEIRDQAGIDCVGGRFPMRPAIGDILRWGVGGAGIIRLVKDPT